MLYRYIKCDERECGNLNSLYISRVKIKNYRNFKNIDVMLGHKAVIIRDQLWKVNRKMKIFLTIFYRKKG